MVYFDPRGVQGSKVSTKWSPETGGWGDLTYRGVTDMPGWRGGNATSQSYARAAEQLLRGSQSAESAVLDAYRALYEQRLGGRAAAQGQYVDQMGAEAASQGLSPDIVRRLVAAQRARSVQEAGAERGASDMLGGLARAELLKGTASELAGLQQQEANLAWQSHQAHQANKRAAQMGLVQGVGTLASSFLGPWAFGLALGANRDANGGVSPQSGAILDAGINNSSLGLMNGMTGQPLAGYAPPPGFQPIYGPWPDSAY